MLLFLFLGLVLGFRKGLVLQLVDLAGFVLSWTLAIRYGAAAGHFLDDLLNLGHFFGSLELEGLGVLEILPLEEYLVVAVGVLVILALTRLIFLVAGRIFDIVRYLPVLRSFNSLLGALVGLVKGVVLVVMLAVTLHFIPHPLVSQARDSSLILGFFAHHAAFLVDRAVDYLIDKALERVL